MVSMATRILWNSKKKHLGITKKNDLFMAYRNEDSLKKKGISHLFLELFYKQNLNMLLSNNYIQLIWEIPRLNCRNIE